MSFDWKRFILILVTGAAAGVLCSAASGRGFALGRSVLVQAGDEVVQVADARPLLDRGALFLDARPRDFWRMSRIPGALPLPEDDFDRAIAATSGKLAVLARQALAEHKAGLTEELDPDCL